MIFIVTIGYNDFKFTDKNDAVIFAEIAKTHAADPDDIRVEIKLYTQTQIDN